MNNNYFICTEIIYALRILLLCHKVCYTDSYNRDFY